MSSSISHEDQVRACMKIRSTSASTCSSDHSGCRSRARFALIFAGCPMQRDCGTKLLFSAHALKHGFIFGCEVRLDILNLSRQAPRDKKYYSVPGLEA